MTPALSFDSVSPNEFPALYAAYEENRVEIVKLLSPQLAQDFASMMDTGLKLDQLLSVNQPKAHVVDPLLDRAWSGLFRNLSTWEHVFIESEAFSLTSDELDQVALARQARQTLIGDDVAFIQLPYRDQWRESAHRLKRLNQVLAQGITVEQALDKLQLTLLLRRIQRLHKAYGDALGITSDTEWDRLSTAWEASFNRFIFGFLYQHQETNETNKKLQELLVAPYEQALSREQERLREIRVEQQKRAEQRKTEETKAAATNPVTEQPEVPQNGEQRKVPQNGEQPEAPQVVTTTAEPRS